MKKLFISILAISTLFAAVSCNKDEKATYKEPTQFVLNTPSYVNALYDLENADYVILTCSQPDYGYTAATTYTVDVSLTEDFASYQTISDSYTSAKMEIDASDFAVAVTNALVESGKNEEDFPITTGVYVRANAIITNSGLGAITSNVIYLPKVLTPFALPEFVMPENMYVIGAYNDWTWTTALPMVKTYNNDGTFWRLLYLTDGFKFNWNKVWDGNEVGYAGVEGRVTDNAGAGVGQSSDGNITVSTPGWYIMVVRTKIVGRSYEFSLEINKPNVYLIGTTLSTDSSIQWTVNDAGLFTVPTTSDGEFVSPAFAQDAASDSGVRACVVIGSEDWWHTEFMVFDNKIVYRATGNDQDRVAGGKGQKLYLNFGNDTGYIK